MNKLSLLKKIKARASADAKLRCDCRFLETMGFLVAKGLLKTNLNIPLLPNKRLKIENVIWAGKNVEPRILEVLPVAVLRLKKHFDFDKNRHKDLACIIDQLHKRMEDGTEFFGIPYQKLKIWTELPMKDKRIKPFEDKKIMKTFRFRPEISQKLKDLAKQKKSTETMFLEKLIQSYGVA